MRQAIVAVLRREGRFLVIRRGPAARGSGFWGPLTGTIEHGESQEAALAREVQEEIGLRVRAVRKVWECPSDDGDFQLHWWTAEIEGGELIVDGQEVSEARWLTAQEYLDLENTFAGDRTFVRRILPTLGPR